MSDPNFVILYVNNPPSSADCYTTLLGKPMPEAVRKLPVKVTLTESRLLCLLHDA